MRTPARRISNRTLVLVRWIAIAGQITGVLTSVVWYGIDLPLKWLMTSICVSVLLNLVSGFLHRGKGLSPLMAMLYLTYDMSQMAAMLYLTGGHANPFNILLIAPMTVGAALLPALHTGFLTGTALILITGLSLQNVPLSWPGGATAPEPLYAFGEWLALCIACLFTSIYIWRMSREARNMQAALGAAQLTLARQKQVAALGGLAAAAAHELGSPLSTITVIAREMRDEIPEDSPLAEDVELLISQSERCRGILKDLSREPETSHDTMTPMTPQILIPLIVDQFRSENPHVDIVIESQGRDNLPPPEMGSAPEIMQGLGTLIQNALQFARRQVKITLQWNQKKLRISIRDDGPGFSSSVLARLGEPYFSTRRDSGKNMGLGVFISQTLLEGTGARLTFRNAPDGGGLVSVEWRRKDLDALRQRDSGQE